MHRRFSTLVLKTFPFPAALLLAQLTGCAHAPQTDCTPVVRAAFDVGSGTTKMTVARVNPCEQRILEVLYKEDAAVSYEGNLKRPGTDGAFDAAIRAKGLETLARLKKTAEDHGATRFGGVATAAFRNASNGRAFVSEINSRLGLNLRVISQEDEASFGFYAALAASGVDAGALVSWDIGGGSMQIVSRREDRSFAMYLADVASVPFKHAVITQVLRTSPASRHSPNPLSAAQIDEGVRLASSLARDGLKSSPGLREIREAIASGKTVVGIGGVHYYSVRGRMEGEPSTLTREGIREALARMRDKDDAALGGGPYAPTDVTNAMLVLGFMEALGIDSMPVRRANLTEGVLTHPEVWKTAPAARPQGA